MNKKKSVILIIALVSIFAISAVTPLTPRSSVFAASQDLIRLTVDNRDSKAIYLELRSPENFYSLRVMGKTIKEFTVERGVYVYTLTGCGLKDTGTFDLTRQMKLINPVCGGNAKSTKTNAGAVDLSEKIKLVRVHIVNETGQKVLVILTGPSTHVFWFDPNETGTYTIAKKPYKVQFLACGVWNKTEFTPYKDAKLVLKCAK